MRYANSQFSADQSTVSLDLLWRNVQDRSVKAQQSLSRVPTDALWDAPNIPRPSEELHNKIANPSPIYIYNKDLNFNWGMGGA